MEGRDSQQWQPNRRGKGSVGACVSRGWRKHPQIRHGSSRFVYIRSKTASFDIWPHFTRFVYRSGIRMRLHGFFFRQLHGIFRSQQPFVRIRESVMPALEQPERPSWTHLELIPHASDTIIPHQRSSTCNSVNRLAGLHTYLKLPTPR